MNMHLLLLRITTFLHELGFCFWFWFRFTYKVVVEMRDSSGTNVLECFGDPKCKKKVAAEHAAEGALWYLEHIRRNQTKPSQ